MADLDPPPTPESSRPVRTPFLPRKAARSVKVIDRTASYIIRFGGGAVIVAVLAIFFFIGKEALPLFLPPSSQLDFSVPSPALGAGALPNTVGMDEYETYSYAILSNGTIGLHTLDRRWQPQPTLLKFRRLDGHPLHSAYRDPGRDYLYLGTSDGNILLAQLKFDPVYTNNGRTVQARLSEDTLTEISATKSPVTHVFGRRSSSGTAHFAAACADGRVYTGSQEEGEKAKIESIAEFSAKITQLAIDGDGRNLYVATADGKLRHWHLEQTRDQPSSVLELGNNARWVTTLDLAIGDNALLLGFNDGSVEEWFGVRTLDGDLYRPLQRIRSFERLPAAVTSLAPSSRNKAFLAGAADGTTKLYFTTSERTLLTLKSEGGIAALCYAPKLTRVLALTEKQTIDVWKISSPHPEISWQTLFGQVWYEGYDAPEFTWQSTGGTDDFESKFSLIPLTFGTLKAALYGLFFAIPIAVMAALYTSQFMSYRLRGLVKPAVEIMAALPSVVVGFLAGLWLAPLLEEHTLSIASLFIIIPTFVLLGVAAWRRLPLRLRSRLPAGLELGAIVPLVIAGFAVSVCVGPWLEGIFFAGDMRQWIFDTTGHQFEQRNSIVIGFAMGFAVIPIIFTISEDALSNVPQHFISGSLALGANRWQTALRVILPTASPGIFSAIMVGFGRAVGETMIVLMATGNTPILSFSPFNGMRTLSANIAVEIPEAPVAGTLYRVLFLTAILLFLLTFVVNTIAEIIRHRLRQRYQAV